MLPALSERPTVPGEAATSQAEPRSLALLGRILALALPVMVEHVLHMLVGLTDTYMANRLKHEPAAATAAVGTMAYFLWFVGLIVSAVSIGATALIARAVGARHRSLANSACGQAISAALALGLGIGLAIFLATEPILDLTGLPGAARPLAGQYLRMLCGSAPFSTVMFVASACLRGAGDTLTPALAMVFVDLVNIFFTYTLTLGRLGMPEMGFAGIGAGTVIAYIVGGMLLFTVLIAGRGAIRLHLHRMPPHWPTLRRILHVGIPSGIEGALGWIAQFIVLRQINGIDLTNRVAAAHNNAVRLESPSYMIGFAIAIAAATLVGQSLGAKNFRRATRVAYLAYGAAASFMVACGLVFIFWGSTLARWISPAEHEVAEMTARCLFITGFIQAGFAAAIVFSGVLRGAGDTLASMVLNLSSLLLVRLAGVLVVVHILHGSLAAIWVVLSGELLVRGALLYGRFVQGRWRKVRV